MTLLEEPEPRSPSSRVVVYAVLLFVAAAIGIAVWKLSAPSAPAVQEQRSPVAAEKKRVAAPPPAPKAPDPTEAESARAARPRPAPPKPAAPPPPTTGSVQFESDVSGASVFVDREYKGATPLTVEGIAPGTHKINLSADGYDGFADTLDVVAGPNAVMVKFREVKLNESIAVTHKHTLGSCKGQLAADTSGIRFESEKKDDSFVVAFAKVETFEVDYLKRNLRLKVRGGRTYNFTNDNADTLFVFHKNVQAARAKLAKM